MICNWILKRNKLIERFIISGRRNHKGVTQCKQFTQDTAAIEKANTGHFVLVSPFSKYAAQYYHEKFMAYLSAKNILKLGKNAVIKSEEEDVELG